MFFEIGIVCKAIDFLDFIPEAFEHIGTPGEEPCVGAAWENEDDM